MYCNFPIIKVKKYNIGIIKYSFLIYPFQFIISSYYNLFGFLKHQYEFNLDTITTTKGFNPL